MRLNTTVFLFLCSCWNRYCDVM